MNPRTVELISQSQKARIASEAAIKESERLRVDSNRLLAEQRRLLSERKPNRASSAARA